MVKTDSVFDVVLALALSSTAKVVEPAHRIRSGAQVGEVEDPCPWRKPSLFDFSDAPPEDKITTVGTVYSLLLTRAGHTCSRYSSSVIIMKISTYSWHCL